MKSALESLEIIKHAPTIYVGCASDIYTMFYHECNIIESALKRYEYTLDILNDLLVKGDK